VHVGQPQFLFARPLVLLQRMKLAGRYLVFLKAGLGSAECARGLRRIDL